MLEAVRELLPGELRFVNLEGPITDFGREAILSGTPRFAAPERVAGWLRGTVDVVSLANNHAFDQGLAGLERTRRVLSDAGIRFATDTAEASMDLKGVHVTLFARDLSAGGEPEGLLEAVRAARLRGAVLVSLHWGKAGSLLPNERQRTLAHALVSAGASAVLGHGPHALQGVEVTPGAVVAYSLGNLAFTCQCTAEEDAYALLFMLGADGTVSDVRAAPLRAGLSRPPARGDAALAGLIADLSRDLGSVAAVDGGVVRLSASEPPTRGGQGAIKPRP